MWDKIYVDLCKEILKDGTKTNNRTGVDTIKLPYKSFELDLKEFPILTVKFVSFKAAALEILWFYQAQSNDVRWLNDRNVKIWNEWKIDEDGIYRCRDLDGNIKFEKDYGIEFAHTIGTAYGYIVNKYQLTQNLIDTLKNNNIDRRMVMSLWQNEFLDTAVLPSCVWNSMWDVTDGKLNVIVTQRSCDVGLGLPFNVTQYALLVNLIAQVTGLDVGKLYWSSKDVHLYENQLDGINEIIKRYETMPQLPAPKLWINKEIPDFFKFDNSSKLIDFKLVDYENYGKVNMQVVA